MDRDKGGIPATSTIGESFENPFLTAALVAAFSFPAAAQMTMQTVKVPCSDIEYIPGLLARDYGESPTGQGIANTSLVQLWRNPETNTWSVLLVLPDGGACVLASGEDWEALEPKPTGTKT